VEEKSDNLLNMALALSDEQLNNDPVLGSGVDIVNDVWEIIVRYIGEEDFSERYGIDFVRLMGGYGIARLPRNKIDIFVSDERVIFVEKSKPLLFSVTNGINASCINPITENLGVHGKGVIVAVIDSGIDYSNDVFRNQDGSTRILEIWDQSLEYNQQSDVENEYVKGRIFNREDLNRALAVTDEYTRYQLVPSRDVSGHGTMVAGIAAGNFAENKNNNIGIATQSDLIVVKLGIPEENSFPRTIELMEAIDYVVKRGVIYNKPIAINLSFGNIYGSHDGTSLVETFLDYVTDIGRNVVCVGTGNEGSVNGHTNEKLIIGNISTIEFVIGEFESSVNIQLWKDYVDIMELEIISPTGRTTGLIVENDVSREWDFGDNNVRTYFGSAKPYSKSQEVFISLIAKEEKYVIEGVWRINITPIKVVNGIFDLWISGGIATGTGFTNPTPDISLTIPSTSAKSISVGAYDVMTDRVADFSGRGFTRNNMIKPDIVAPGVNISSAMVGGGISVASGTSFATPFVTGSSALLMEWGIIKGNDIFLYGEKVKAYLQRGARQLPAYNQWPNPIAGWGALCLKDSFPE